MHLIENPSPSDKFLVAASRLMENHSDLVSQQRSSKGDYQRIMEDQLRSVARLLHAAVMHDPSIVSHAPVIRRVIRLAHVRDARASRMSLETIGICIADISTIHGLLSKYYSSSSKQTIKADLAFMQRAIELARHSMEAGGPPCGAVVVRHGDIIGEAGNAAVTTADPTAHAELLAIRCAAAKLGRRHLYDCMLYSTLEPCPMCISACYWARISNVCYGAKCEESAMVGFLDVMIYDEIAKPPQHRRVRAVVAMQSENQALLDEYAVRRGW